MNAKKNYRPNELEYRSELGSIQWEIKCQRASLWRNPYQWLFSPVVKDLKRRATLIKKALRKPALPPLPDYLRNPFDIPPTPVEVEFIKVARWYFNAPEELD
jgi:hypothetical protein